MFGKRIITYPKAALLITISAASMLLSAQAQQKDLTFVQMSKDLYYQQTGLTRVALLRPSDLPYGFSSDIECASRAAALRVKPTITLPADSRFRSIYKLTPALGLDGPDADIWRFGFKDDKLTSDFDNWGTRTKSELDQSFPPGRYIFKIQGRTLNLNLPRDAYPPAPVCKLSGGKWSGGAYYISPTKDLTVNTGMYSKYGSNVNDYIFIDIEEDASGKELFDYTQVAKKIPNGPRVSSSKSYKHRIPANTLELGKKYRIACGYGAITSQSVFNNVPVLVSFGSETVVTIIAQPSS